MLRRCWPTAQRRTSGCLQRQHACVYHCSGPTSLRTMQTQAHGFNFPQQPARIRESAGRNHDCSEKSKMLVMWGMRTDDGAALVGEIADISHQHGCVGPGATVKKTIEISTGNIATLSIGDFATIPSQTATSVPTGSVVPVGRCHRQAQHRPEGERHAPASRASKPALYACIVCNRMIRLMVFSAETSPISFRYCVCMLGSLLVHDDTHARGATARRGPATAIHNSAMHCAALLQGLTQSRRRTSPRSRPHSA